MFVSRLLIVFLHKILKKSFRNTYYQSVKQFGSRKGPTFCRALSGSKLFAKIISGRQNSPLVGKVLIRFFLLVFQGTLVRTPKIISKPSTDFECDVCQKKFRFRSNLKAHQAIHDQQRIFECSLCQNSLIVTALHNCHLVAKVVGQPENKNTDGCSDGHGHSRDTRTHAQTRIRRFMCDKCARTFASESNLKIHMKTHTIDKLRDILKATSSRFTAE